jgi:hypothetical protein
VTRRVSEKKSPKMWPNTYLPNFMRCLYCLCIKVAKNVGCLSCFQNICPEWTIVHWAKIRPIWSPCSYLTFVFCAVSGILQLSENSKTTPPPTKKKKKKKRQQPLKYT